MVHKAVGAFNMPQVLLQICKQFTILVCCDLQGTGQYSNKIGWGVRPASQNPDPIYDKNLIFSKPIYD